VLEPVPVRTGSDVQQARYRRRLSAPLVDRFDLRLDVRPPEPDAPRGEASAVVRERVVAAVARQHARFRGARWRRNAHIPAGALSRAVPLASDAADAWRDRIEERSLTGRGAARILRVARTLADLDDATGVSAAHVTLASMLREDVP
jgi:magnesium chelatase family protein